MQPKYPFVEITKASGEKSAFDPVKLFNSLLKCSADEADAQAIVDAITPQLYPGISTKKIYKKAFALLKTRSRFLAARYNLKNAIMQLGPSGYPFEKFVGELLRHQGYRVTVGQIAQGKCISHEIDVIATKDHHHFMIECKYHNQRGTVCDVKIPLYIHSRFLDVCEVWAKHPEHSAKFHQGWVITNTRFTLDAIKYGNCSGLKLVSWDYPAKESLKDLIDTLGLYPVTTLTSLTIAEKKALLERNVVLCLEVDESILTELGIKTTRIKKVLEECRNLCCRVTPRMITKQNKPVLVRS